jgi:hypothetical protein
MECFRLNRLSDRSDEALIAEMQRVAAIVSHGILTKSEFAKHARVNVTTLQNHFGSWKECLATAGLAHRYSGAAITSKMRRCAGTRALSDEAVLDEVRSVAKRLKPGSLTVEQFNSLSTLSADVIRRRFGSWRAGLQKAGVASTRYGKRYTNDECFENLLQVWTHYGRQPQHDEMRLAPSTVGPKAYTGRWGTWLKALEAFVNKMNQDDDPSETSTTAVGNAFSTNPENTKRNQRRTTADADVRDIKLGLRWKVFQRDRFRCVKCGASPANDLGCKQLHADHILPFSKGGKTVLENLQTLCERCNLGKGNRIEAET